MKTISDKEYQDILNKNKLYYEKNKEKRKEQMKRYIDNNKDNQKEYKKTYYEKNKEKVKAATKKYKLEHKEESDKYYKEYWEKNKDRLKKENAERNKSNWKNMSKEDKDVYWIKKNAWEKQKKIDDPNYAIKKRLRLRVWQAFNGIRKKHSDEMGIDYKKIVEHLNKTIPIDYKDNPNKYEIDHIIPLSSFDFSNAEDIKNAFAPENHQWLTSTENALKKDLSPEEWNNKKNAI
jgi:hypothetical protein